MTTARIENGPPQSQLMFALHDDKTVSFSVTFQGGERLTVQTELWSFAKIGRNGYHNGRCVIGGIMQADKPIPGGEGEPRNWTTFVAKYNQRSRTGEIRLGVEYDDAFAGAGWW